MTILTFFIVLFIGGLIYYFYFIGGTKSVENAHILGTQSKSNNVFHQVLVNNDNFNFKGDGIFLCFEKVSRSNLIVMKGQPGYFSFFDQCNLFGIDPSFKNVKERGLQGTIGLIRRTLDDPKPIILTHWFETSDLTTNIRYNVYEDIKNKDYDLPKSSITQYAVIANEVKEKLRKGKYTHLVIGCTGWNTRQDSSLETYTDWLQCTAEAAQEDKVAYKFKPFFIGFTWPSLWISPLISIINKANDADELGLTHFNYLIWKEIMPSLQAAGIKVPIITIGHSLGARIMSRMVYSRFMLTDDNKGDKVDLVIDFQGAYPLSRFCEKSGTNGGLYAGDASVKTHVLTCSKYDRAIKMPFWSRGYIGNSTAIWKLHQNKVAMKDFGFCTLDSTGRFIDFPANKTKVLVDAKSVIKHSNSFFAGAHSDVANKEAGRFIWELIKKLT